MSDERPAYERLWDKNILGAQLDSLSPAAAEHLIKEIDAIETAIRNRKNAPPVE